MKVYVMTSDEDYCGDSTLGVFSSRKKADEYVEKKFPNAIKDGEEDYEITHEWGKQSIYIDEYTLDEVKE